MTDGPAARVRRCARMFAGLWLADVLAVLAVRIWWGPGEVLALLIGFGLAWLTAVALFMFQEARHAG